MQDENNTTHAVLQGYAKLAEAVIYCALVPRSQDSQETDGSYKERLKNNIRFSNSKFIDHYADVFNFPVDKIRRRIYEENTKLLLKFTGDL
jgi:hypothetical protein